MKKHLSLVLALLMLLPMIASCAESKENAEETAAAANIETPSAEIAEEAAAEEDNPYYEGYVDPFTDVDFDGDTLTVYTSVNQRGTLTSSNYLIEGPEELTGDLAPDAAIQRNMDVCERLNIELAFEPADFSYDVVASNIRQLLQSGDAAYDVIINDIYGLAPITPEGLFHNAYDGKNFNFDAPWWYDEFMSDISLNSNLRFMLAGDYFIDMLRCTHCLVMNKGMYTDMYGDPEDVYAMVLNNEWTLDKFRELEEACYLDLNGNGAHDVNDQYGHVAFEFWGPMIPWLISADPGFIDRGEDGYPIITVNNERSVALTEKLNAILNNDAAGINLTGGDEAKTEAIFLEGRSLFLGYQRLASLENASFRDAEIDLAVLPYPKLDELQKNYVSSTHDTAELGFIPVAVPYERLDFISTVLEVLCRETYTQVLPEYYESSLKIKYTRDNTSAQMIDIIHDNHGNGFALAFSNGLSGVLLANTFNAAISANSTDFASKYKSLEKPSNKLLEKMIDKCEDMIAEKGGR
ncbi:MAG: hypothetical protein J6N32_01905 [Clostridia bacterium]|nr:hypothetical protein [Clostridia bacterium]